MPASKKATGNRTSADSTPQPPADPDWAVLIYLAGHLPKHIEDDFRENLKGVIKAGSSGKVAILVQYDGEDGAVRYILPAGAARPPVKEKLGPVNSGSAEALENFMRWGLLSCHANQTAVVIGGWGALKTEASHKNEQLFTVCWDSSTGDYIDAADLGNVFRNALRPTNGPGESQGEMKKIDLLCIDSCQMQFLELAYELGDVVKVLIGSQTYVPLSGWEYLKILTEWHHLAAKDTPARELATKLVELIAGSYKAGADAEKDKKRKLARVAVSALDLSHLDTAARSLDTLFIGLMQSLGEGLIWQARSLMVSMYRSLDTGDHVKDAKASAGPVPDPANDRVPQEELDYDCGSLLALMNTSMHCMADEAVQGWLVTTLQRDHRDACAHFRQALKREMKGVSAGDAGRREALLDLLKPVSRVRASSVSNHRGGSVTKRQRVNAAQTDRFLELLEGRVKARVQELAAKGADPADSLSSEAGGFDEAVENAVLKYWTLLPEDRREDFNYMIESRKTARRLARQARRAYEAVMGRDGVATKDGEAGPLVFASRELRVGKSPAEAVRRWPSRSGVSLYRPIDSLDLSSLSYRKFAFHDRIHWASLMGAANLITSYPRALWRLVSSLLSSGGASTRRDLQQRLTGQNSVMSGLRDQFRVMVPGPCLSLSLEKRNSLRTGNQDDEHDYYLLRLESATRGAVVTEQISRVQVTALDAAMKELETLLGSVESGRDSLKKIRAIGGLLGEDVLQKLGDKLEAERQAALKDVGGETVHLQLQVPRELMQYPWELMLHRGKGLSEQFALGRQVLMETGLARGVPHRRAGRVRPLIIGAPRIDGQKGREDGMPEELTGACKEAEAIAEWFKKTQEEMGEVIDFNYERDTRIGVRLTCSDFRELLRSGDYDIVHFAGHAAFDPDHPEDSAWLLSDNKLEALQLRNTLLEAEAPPWLVYANACEGARESKDQRYQGSVFGLATAFINHGVAAYIGPLWPVDDEIAACIAEEFYQQLLSERLPLGESLRQAKMAGRKHAEVLEKKRKSELQDKYAGMNLGWASIVLYGDPTEELFQVLAGTGGGGGGG